MKLFNRYFMLVYFTFFVSGLTVLLIGSILPYLMQDCNINYATAGTFLSSYAIGNLCASFFSPYLAGKIGRKRAIVILASLVSLSFLFISFLPSIPVIIFLFFTAGVGRGSISNINNAIINDNSKNSVVTINVLHSFFAVGAFVAPFFTSFSVASGFDWKQVLYVCILLNVASVIAFLKMPLTNFANQEETSEKKREHQAIANSAYLKSIDFYLLGFILFFYLGFENCVNGWFVTYLRDIGVMSSVLATNLVSVLWIVVIVGRLSCAYLSNKVNKKTIILINCIGCTLFFFLLISTKHTPVIIISMIGIGLFLGGIYPTTVANAGKFIKGNANAMALLLAIASLGGILLPQIVGIIADLTGISGGIRFLLLDVLILIVFALWNRFRKEIE